MIRASTPAPTRRQRKHQQRLDDLLDIAMRLVADDGIDALTMPRLADAADAAVGGLYRYFSGKDALIAGLQVRAGEAFVAFLDERWDAEAPPLSRVRAVVEAWPAFAQAEPQKHALLDASLSDPRALLGADAAAAVATAVAPALERCARALREAVEEGTLRPGDEELRTHALWAAVHGAGHFVKRDRLVPERLRAAAIRRELVEGLLAGWT
ncbi:MAG: TetR/AcrR family transcriptional regulator [Alphaproteobacteria bacterium]|nr:TetR/AcrR family transcriptional regulator [Alphaproteobacteria bacterium]